MTPFLLDAFGDIISEIFSKIIETVFTETIKAIFTGLFPAFFAQLFQQVFRFLGGALILAFLFWLLAGIVAAAILIGRAVRRRRRDHAGSGKGEKG